MKPNEKIKNAIDSYKAIGKIEGQLERTKRILDEQLGNLTDEEFSSYAKLTQASPEQIDKYKVGDTVFWDDPDGSIRGFNSGVYIIDKINGDTISMHRKNYPDSEAQAHWHEIRDPNYHKQFKVGDLVVWNSETGPHSGIYKILEKIDNELVKIGEGNKPGDLVMITLWNSVKPHKT